MRIRVLLAAACAAASLTLGLGTAGTAHAVAGGFGPGNCWINAGNPGNYYYSGAYAGQVEQIYNTCDGTVGVHWQWSSGFRAANPNAYVQLALNSPYWSSWWGPLATLAKQSQDVWWWDSGLPHGTPKPDQWRAGAMVNHNNCIEWGSLHWYANGTEVDGPYGGCDDFYPPA